MSQLRVLVVGASIAGPTTAYWLAKAGAHVTVIERFDHLRTNGQNIDIRTVGVTVMRKMPGMEEAVRAKVVPMDGISFVRANGKPYGIITATGDPEQQSLVSEYEIHRGDLAQIIVNLTKENRDIKYIFGEQVASMQQNEKEDGPITVNFANGLPSTEYDLVVACDGATSRTRAMGLGCGLRDYVEPTNCWAAYFSIEQDPLKGSRMGHAYSAVGGRFMAVGSSLSGGSKVALMGINQRHDQDAMKRFRGGVKAGDAALKEYVAQHYKGAGWIADEVMNGLIESKDFYANEVVQIKCPSLHKGRFVMVGDCGYAPGFTGTGTSLALAGGYVLAGEICKHKDDLAAGLRGYDSRMKPLVDSLQKVPALIPTIFAPQTTWGIWVRNNLFAFVAWSRIINFSQKYFANSFAMSDKFGLPDYEWVS
jgi:2-polyprenyl-6-methoxyphenol hydroxylase-like FAD-dependent oxidoreductase